MSKPPTSAYAESPGHLHDGGAARARAVVVVEAARVGRDAADDVAARARQIVREPGAAARPGHEHLALVDAVLRLDLGEHLVEVRPVG